ncbi:MAG: hypothetical protein AAF715_03190 [Myxococcota bacterium]
MRFRAVARIAADLRGLVDRFRRGGFNHPELPQLRQNLHLQLVVYLQVHDMLALDFVRGELSFEGVRLEEASELARPLYRMGVRQLVMEAGLEPGELIALTNAWARAVEAPLRADFIADLDAFDLDHIWLTLAGPGAVSDVPEAAKETMTPDLVAAEADAAGPERARWLEELQAGDAGQRHRALASLLSAAEACEGDAERRELLGTAREALASLVRRGRFDDVCALLSGSSTAPHDPRSEWLDDPEILLPLLDEFQRFPSRELHAVLVGAGSRGAEALLDRALDLAPGPVRDAMKELLLVLPLSEEKLTEGLTRADADLGPWLLDVAFEAPEQPPPPALWAAALDHPATEVRARCLALLSHEQYDRFCDHVYPLLADDDQGLRRSALNLVMRRHDVGAAPFLAVRLDDVDVSEDELHSLVVAAGRLGSPATASALRNLLESRKEPRIKVATLLALAKVEGEGARDLLAKHAEKKLFVGRQIREAAEEGLRRLDARLSGRQRTPSAPWPEASVPEPDVRPAADPEFAPSAPEKAPPSWRPRRPRSSSPAPLMRRGAPTEPGARAAGSAAVPSPPVPSAPVPSAPVPSAPVPSAPVPSAPVPSVLRRSASGSTIPGRSAPPPASQPGRNAPPPASQPGRNAPPPASQPGRNAPVPSVRDVGTVAASTSGSAPRTTTTPPPARRSAPASPRSAPRDTTHRRVTHPTMAAVDPNAVDRVDVRRLRRLSHPRMSAAPVTMAPSSAPGRTEPNDEPRFARAAQRLISGGALDEALSVLDEAEADYADDPDRFALIATVYERRGDGTAALDALREAVLRAPDRADLAERLYALRDHESASG